MITSTVFDGNKILFKLNRPFEVSSFYQVVVENTYSELLNSIERNDVVVDAGANIGAFTLLAAQRSKQVIAIEPDPYNAEALNMNLKLNRINNVVIIRKILYNKANLQLKFKSDGTMSAISSFGDASIETTTLDVIANELNINPTILKIDIEGAEKYAFNGMRATINSLKAIQAEIHDEESLENLMQFTDMFEFIQKEIDNTSEVKKYVLRHPLRILNLESHNKFRTTRRVLLSASTARKNPFPKIVFCYKKKTV